MKRDDLCAYFGTHRHRDRFPAASYCHYTLICLWHAKAMRSRRCYCVSEADLASHRSQCARVVKRKLYHFRTYPLRRVEHWGAHLVITFRLKLIYLTYVTAYQNLQRTHDGNRLIHSRETAINQVVVRSVGFILLAFG
jgi:hypothetical protein